MSFQGTAWAYELIGISALAKLVAIRIGDLFPPVGEFTPCRLQTLLEWTGASEVDVRLAVAELINKTDILFEDRGNGEWFFLLPIENLNMRRFEPKTPDHSKLTIYVISRGRFIKIGISFNELMRMKALKAAAPEQKFALIWRSVGPAYLIRKVEKNAHRVLASHLIGNEWFSISAEGAIDVVRVEMAKLGLVTV
jgi:T5orf172 domain